MSAEARGRNWGHVYKGLYLCSDVRTTTPNLALAKMKFLAGVVLLASVLDLSSAVSTFTPARPPAIPLAVRSPYVSTWLDCGSDGGNGGYLAGQWPQFWA